MIDVVKGMAAGAVATAALTLVMLFIKVLGFEPQLELPRLLLNLLDAPADYVLGWIGHLVIGSVILGGLFAQVEHRLGVDTHTKSGILYGVVVWLVMMLVFMPAAGGGYFGFQLSMVTPLVMLVLEVLYGVVLGWTYGKLSPTYNPFTKHHPA